MDIRSSLFKEVAYIRCLIITRNFVSRCEKTIDTIHSGAVYSEILEISRSDCETLVNKKLYRTIENGPSESKSNAVYTLLSETHMFSIRARDRTQLCGFDGYLTDHPRIFVLEANGYRSPFTRKASIGRNLDLFTYFIHCHYTIFQDNIGGKLSWSKAERSIHSGDDRNVQNR